MSEKKTNEILETNLLEHPSVKAWKECQSNNFKPEQIEILTQKKKGSVFRLRGVGLNKSSVIAKRCKSEKAMIERVIYEEVFPYLSVSIPFFYGYIKEHDGIFWWLFLEDVGNQPLSPILAEHRTLAAEWMGEMNTSTEITKLNSHLPNRGPEYYHRYLRSSREMIPEIQIFYSLEASHQELLNNIVAMCEFLEEHWNQIEAFCNHIPRTLVHGDCQVKNAHVRSTQDGLVLVPFDWASAGWGLPATDLGQLSLPYKSLPKTVPDWAAYLSVVRNEWPYFDLETVQQLANLGQIFWALKVISKGLPEFNDKKTYLEGLLFDFGVYASVLDTAINAGNWTN
jgi:thiamine kinase-like enzyme